jgi:signal transduction histidine kinase
MSASLSQAWLPGSVRLRPPRFTPVVVASFACVFSLLLLPAPHRRWTEIGISALAALAVIAGSTALRRAPQLVGTAVPVGFLLVVSLLRDATGGSISGFGGFYLLPVIYFALFYGLAEVLLGLVLTAAATVVPLLVVGAPDYPISGWRGTVVQVVVSAIAGLTIQRLVQNVRANAALTEERNTQLLALDRLKDEFMSVVSHEFRTPLTSIHGYLELVLEDGSSSLDPEQLTYLGVVERNVNRLQNLVEDLLFVARLEQSGLELHPESVDLGLLLSDATATAQPAAAAKDVELELVAPEHIAVHVDRVRVAQLVDNLVSNAVKFTPAGGRVRIAAESSSDAVAVQVSDTGVGIPTDELPQLFTRFFRASTAQANHIPGTGLGLRISQSIAQAHGSEILVESALGEGTTFTFELPLVIAQTKV